MTDEKQEDYVVTVECTLLAELDERARYIDNHKAPHNVYMNVYGTAASEIRTLRAERDELREALEPSAENEIAYLNDEVTFWITDIDGDGHAYRRREIVPWSAVEEIMAKIRARAALNRGDGK